jgi:hypothetical protein
MKDVVGIEKQMYSTDPQAHVSFDQKDIEQYADKVETNYHKRRREEWRKAYLVNYRNKHKDQVKIRKSELD